MRSVAELVDQGKDRVRVAFGDEIYWTATSEQFVWAAEPQTCVLGLVNSSSRLATLFVIAGSLVHAHGSRGADITGRPVRTRPVSVSR